MGRLTFSRRLGRWLFLLGGHTAVLGRRLSVTWGNHHETVIPAWPLTLTTMGFNTSHTILARISKLSSDNSVRAELALPAGRRSW